MAENRFKKGIENIKQPDMRQHTQDVHDDNVTQHTHNAQHETAAQNTRLHENSKNVNARGKREERYGLLLDKELKDDIKKLANAEGSRSINDFIVNLLISYVDKPENQEILKAYEALHKLRRENNK